MICKAKTNPTDKPVGHFIFSADRDWRAVQVRIKHRCTDEYVTLNLSLICRYPSMLASIQIEIITCFDGSMISQPFRCSVGKLENTLLTLSVD